MAYWVTVVVWSKEFSGLLCVSVAVAVAVAVLCKLFLAGVFFFASNIWRFVVFKNMVAFKKIHV